MSGALSAAAAERANLGIALKRAGRLEEAADAFRAALLLAPDHAGLHNSLGGEQAYRTAIVLQPDYVAPYHNLGSALRDAGRFAEAPICFHRALRIAPDIPDLHGGLATLDLYLDRTGFTVAGYRRMIALQPGRADAYINLGGALRQQGALPPAERAYRRALDIVPDDSGAHFNLSLLLLLTGRFREGWPGYEERWRTRQLAKDRRAFPQQQWQGEAAEGKTILLHAEQGFGDTLQFCRYAALVKAQGLRVILEVQPPLLRLLKKLEGCDTVIAHGDPLPAFDLHCPLMSLPLALGTESPGTVPYIRVENRFPLPGPGPKVGVCWAGAPRADSPEQAAFDRRRSLPDAALAQLVAAPGVQFFSLQKDKPSSLTDYMDRMTDFADTAALIASLDLVISVDTAIAHLAGAMGKPVWLLNRFDTDWRWGSEGASTDWYPTMRIFRQRTSGDWAELIRDVAKALMALRD